MVSVFLALTRLRMSIGVNAFGFHLVAVGKLSGKVLGTLRQLETPQTKDMFLFSSEPSHSLSLRKRDTVSLIVYCW